MIVQGKSQTGGDEDELCREFTRDFTLPNDVDVKDGAIRAQLDQSTRLLTLFCNLKGLEKEVVNQVSSAPYAPQENVKIGTTRENHNSSNLEFEIYLGNELKDGVVRVESTLNTLSVSVCKKSWDKYGDFSVELNRQIKLPSKLNLQRIEHGVDFRTANLHVKIPFQ